MATRGATQTNALPASGEAANQMHILLAYDGSPHAEAAVSLVLDLPGVHPPVKVTNLAVMPTQYFGEHERLQSLLNELQARLESHGLQATTELKTGNPAATINNRAVELEEEGDPVDLIVMGAKGLRATLGILLGGVAQQVVEYSNCPVLVVRGVGDRSGTAARPNIRKILVVVDGSPHSQRAVEYLAPPCGDAGEGKPGARRCSWLPAQAEMHVMHVLPPLTPAGMAADASYGRTWTVGPEVLYPAPVSPANLEQLAAEEEAEGKRVLEQAAATLKAAGIQARQVIKRGDAATEIIEYATQEQIDLIVCGSRGLSQVTAWLLGSVSRKLVHYAQCSVLIVK
jgi:nucleotide-binding universal stress UspA family protein